VGVDLRRIIIIKKKEREHQGQSEGEEALQHAAEQNGPAEIFNPAFAARRDTRATTPGGSRRRSGPADVNYWFT